MFNPQMLLQQLPMLKQNPVGMIMNAGFNIPQGQNMGDPRSMVMNLINSGQVDQNTLNMAQNVARQMGYNISE